MDRGDLAPESVLGSDLLHLPLVILERKLAEAYSHGDRRSARQEEKTDDARFGTGTLSLLPILHDQDQQS